jgi:hypothetical protein
MEDHPWWLQTATGSGVMGKREEQNPPEPLTSEWIKGELRKLPAHGAYTLALKRHARVFVDVLLRLQPDLSDGLSPIEKARKVEGIIRANIIEWDTSYLENVGEALLFDCALIGTGLRNNTSSEADKETVRERRTRYAAEALNIMPSTYEKKRRLYLEELAEFLYMKFEAAGRL